MTSIQDKITKPKLGLLEPAIRREREKKSGWNGDWYQEIGSHSAQHEPALGEWSVSYKVQRLGNGLVFGNYEYRRRHEPTCIASGSVRLGTR